jgi:D-tyrosyl-tRNA(Tyr) deacylase
LVENTNAPVPVGNLRRQKKVLELGGWHMCGKAQKLHSKSGLCFQQGKDGAMRAVVQRVNRAEVRVAGEVIGRIGQGLLVFAGVSRTDTLMSAAALAEKTAYLRVFDDERGRMNRSVLEIRGQLLCVSQFTLCGDCRKGRRPSFDQAAPPEVAEFLYEGFVAALRGYGLHVETGRFRAMMEVELVNDGPVTLLLDSDKLF